MIKNYLKIVWRNLWKHKLYSFINLTGLTVGITACILIFLYVQFELSFDTYHKQAKNIYRLTEILHMPKENRPQAVTSPPMAPSLKENFPEIKKAVRIVQSGRVLAVKEKNYMIQKLSMPIQPFLMFLHFPS